MSASRAPITADQLAEFPDDGLRYEVIDGVLFVTPSPSRVHQRVQAELFIALHAYARALGLEILMAPTAVRASSLTEVLPDLLVLPRYVAGRNDTPYEQLTNLVLAIEIVSPSSVVTDRGAKRRLYVDAGVKEYWVVDTAGRYVERWTAGSVEADVSVDMLIWAPVDGREGLTVELADFFRAIDDR